MNEFDLGAFWNSLKAARKRILLNCCVAAAVALVIGFSIPKLYVASASLASEQSDEMQGMGGLASLSSFIDLKKGTDAIGPSLYPDVIATNDFLVDLLYVKVRTKEGVPMDFQTYMKTQMKAPWWAWVGVGMKKVRKMLFPPEQGNLRGEDGRIDPTNLSLDDETLIQAMRGVVSCNMDEETGVINLAVSVQDPVVATMMVDSVMVHLQDFITHYRTSKVRIDLEYYEGLEKSAKADYEKAKRAYADYCDTHQGLALQSYISEQESLENEMQMSFNTYSQMRQQVQAAQAKVQEKTPAFTVLKRASVPNLPVSPKKSLILFACLFLTFFGTVGWIYFRLLLSPAPKNGGSTEEQ